MRSMDEDRISVIEAARRVGFGKQGTFKVLKRLGIETVKERSSNHAGQAIAYITLDDFARLEEYVVSKEPETTPNGEVPTDFGVFYLIQLEPDHDPGRFKVGFAVNLGERLRSHRCSAPFAEVVDTWPCKRSWENTAIDCVTTECEQLHTEVFRTDDLESVIARCNEFFALMPGGEPASETQD